MGTVQEVESASQAANDWVAKHGIGWYTYELSRLNKWRCVLVKRRSGQIMADATDEAAAILAALEKAGE